jgi:hypothetical protein
MQIVCGPYNTGLGGILSAVNLSCQENAKDSFCPAIIVHWLGAQDKPGL